MNLNQTPPNLLSDPVTVLPIDGGRLAPMGRKAGFGIMLDILVAAGCTVLVVALWRFI